MPPIRIAFLIHTLESGGAEGQLVEWLRALPPEEFDRRVICLVKGGFHEQAVRDMRIPVEILGYRPMRRPDGSLDLLAAFTFLPAFFRLVRSLRLFRPHIFQTVLIMSDAMGALAAGWIRPRPLLVGSRLALTDCARIGKRRERVLRWAVAKADRILCNSAAVAEDVVRSQGADPSKIATIYNGVDWSRFSQGRSTRDTTRAALGLGTGDTAIGCVAQLRPEKDHESLLRAFVAIRTTHPETVLLLVGSGSREATLRDLAGQLGIADRVRFLGVRKDIPEILGALDLLVLPSRTEGFSNVVLEGLASGTPLIATAVGGNVEALGGGRHGVLIPPDNAEALAAAIRQVLDCPEEARRRAQAAQIHAREVYSLEALHRNTRDFYRSLSR